MKKFFSSIKDNRYLPFIIIFVVIILLIVLNIATSRHNNEYKNKKVVFNFEDTENVEPVNTDIYETETESYSENEEDTESDVNETNYTDVEYDVTTEDEYNDDLSVDESTDEEPILFSSKKFLENTAKGFFEQQLKYRKFFKNKALFETRNEMPIDDIKIKSANIKTNEVLISCVYTDGDDSSAQEATLQFKVENNKIVDVILK